MAISGAVSDTHRVAILLSTYNGEQFLPEQLASLLQQTVSGWRLYWRDDGSTDGTRELVSRFMASVGPDRFVAVEAESRIGASASFLHLLRAACADGNDIVAFADQDDVWLPHKLARGIAALGGAAAGRPALYCARQMLVGSDLRHIALSFPVRRVPPFPAALAQNIATGCTVMLNREAAELVAASRAPDGMWHDWWCYLLVAAAGGALLFDTTPVVLYRQHNDNVVGAPSTFVRRGVAALRRGPDAFMQLLRQNVTALAGQPHLISADARRQLALIADALEGGVLRRLAVLHTCGLRRQTWPETMLFRLWFVLA